MRDNAATHKAPVKTIETGIFILIAGITFMTAVQRIVAQTNPWPELGAATLALATAIWRSLYGIFASKTRPFINLIPLALPLLILIATAAFLRWPLFTQIPALAWWIFVATVVGTLLVDVVKARKARQETSAL